MVIPLQGFVLENSTCQLSLLIQGWQVYGVVTIFSEVLQVPADFLSRGHPKLWFSKGILPKMAETLRLKIYN